MRHLIVLLLMVMSVPASAEIYSWTDAAGTIHFTEELSSVPKQYRKKMKIRDDVLLQPRQETASELAPVAEVPSPATASSRKQDSLAENPATDRYAGKTGPAWQAEFRKKRADLQAIDEQIRQVQADMTASRELITPARGAELNARREVLSQQYEAAAAGLNQLVEQANQVGLPKEFSE